jgi:hypothetical protein
MSSAEKELYLGIAIGLALSLPAFVFFKLTGGL